MEWTLIIGGLVVSTILFLIYRKSGWTKKLIRTKLESRLLANSNAFYR